MPKLETQSHGRLGESWMDTSRMPSSPTNPQSKHCHNLSTQATPKVRSDELASWFVTLFTQECCEFAMGAFPFCKTEALKGSSTISIVSYFSFKSIDL